jgi:hypothetical protein
MVYAAPFKRVMRAPFGAIRNVESRQIPNSLRNDIVLAA